jgi:hypothetical protein
MMLRLLVVLIPFAVVACVPREPGLTTWEMAEIRQYAPDADLNDLTPAQVGALSNALHSGDGLDIPYQIESILNW